MNNGYPLEILKAYHIKKTRFTEQPFFNLVHDLYKERLKATDNKDEIEKVYKVILNSIYGVTLNAINIKQLSDYETDLYDVIDGKLVFYESKYVAGNMYNPVFGTYITADTRMKLFNDFNLKLDKVISINTDGVYLTSKVNLPVNKVLGGYSYKNLPKIMFMGSGRYFVNNGNGVDDKESRFRGVPLKPSGICEIMRDNKQDQTIELVKEKPIKLKESVRNSNYFSRTFAKFPVQDYTEIDQFNVFNKVVKQIYFKTERRYWYNEIVNISDLWDKQIESRGIEIGDSINKFNLLVGLILFDILFTLYCVKYLGAAELNPLCDNFNRFMIIKVIVSIGALSIVYWKREDKYIKISVVLSILLYSIVAISNLWQTVNYLYY
jgi:hypothetical protein